MTRCKVRGSSSVWRAGVARRAGITAVALSRVCDGQKHQALVANHVRVLPHPRITLTLIGRLRRSQEHLYESQALAHIRRRQRTSRTKPAMSGTTGAQSGCPVSL
jgi:hypothetical protein